jgi:hypothetical protein
MGAVVPGEAGRVFNRERIEALIRPHVVGRLI